MVAVALQAEKLSLKPVKSATTFSHWFDHL